MIDSPYYLQCLEEIDKGPYTVTNWEATFIESMLEQQLPQLTAKQVDIIRWMAKKYLGATLK